MLHAHSFFLSRFSQVWSTSLSVSFFWQMLPPTHRYSTNPDQKDNILQKYSIWKQHLHFFIWKYQKPKLWHFQRDCCPPIIIFQPTKSTNLPDQRQPMNFHSFIFPVTIISFLSQFSRFCHNCYISVAFCHNCESIQRVCNHFFAHIKI